MIKFLNDLFFFLFFLRFRIRHFPFVLFIYYPLMTINIYIYICKHHTQKSKQKLFSQTLLYYVTLHFFYMFAKIRKQKHFANESIQNICYYVANIKKHFGTIFMRNFAFTNMNVADVYIQIFLLTLKLLFNCWKLRILHTIGVPY